MSNHKHGPGKVCDTCRLKDQGVDDPFAARDINTDEMVQRHGWMVTGVFGEGYDFAYTIGGPVDLMARGLDARLLHPLLNTAMRHIIKNHDRHPKDPLVTPDVIYHEAWFSGIGNHERLNFMFVEQSEAVDPSDWTQGTWYYERHGLPVPMRYSLLWPDKHGTLPNEQSVSRPISEAQFPW